jgi:hypothetical protein
MPFVKSLFEIHEIFTKSAIHAKTGQGQALPRLGDDFELV